MFNRSKKYGIVKGLPFVCFANVNINASDAFISGVDNIKVVVDGETYVLKNNMQIYIDKSANINIMNILNLDEEWKKGNAGDYNSELPANLSGERYDLVSFTLDDVENKTGDILTTLSAKKYNDIKSGLTLNFESVYKLVDNSILTDGTNTIDIKDKVFLFSDLKDLSTVEKLENFIKTKLKEETFGSEVEGCLKDVKVGSIDFDKFFIAECLKDGKLDNDQVRVIVDEIKAGNIVIITFMPYINYDDLTDLNFTLDDGLKKIRKLKNINTNIGSINTKLKKLVKEKTVEDIKSIINTELCITDDASTTYEVTLVKNKINIKITKDDCYKFSEPMTGKIIFEIDGTKNIQYDTSKFNGNEIPVTFGEEIRKGDKGYGIINTDTKQSDFKEQVKKYLGNTEAKEDTYGITFNNFGADDTGTAQDGFEVTVKFKGVVKDFTKEKDKDTVNINIKLDIDDNASGDFQLQTDLQKDYNSKPFNQKLVYNDFITELEKVLGKTAGSLSAANVIKSIKFSTDGSNFLQWDSTNKETIETLKITHVKITLNKADNGTYVKKKASGIPPAKDTVTFKLNVTTNVNGYKVKTGNETLSVTVNKDDLTGKTFKDEISKTFKDCKFTIKKGQTVINDGNTIDTADLNVYSVELTEGSNFIEEDKKSDEDNKNKQNGDESTEDDTNNKSKKCCGGKCYGGDKNKKK